MASASSRLVDAAAVQLDKWTAIAAGAVAVIAVAVMHRAGWFEPGRHDRLTERGVAISFVSLAYVMAAFAAAGAPLTGLNSTLISALLTGAVSFVMDERFTRASGLAAAEDRSGKAAAREAINRLATPRYGRTLLLGLFDLMLTAVLASALSSKLEGQPGGKFLLALNLVGPLLFWSHGNALRIGWARDDGAIGPVVRAAALAAAAAFLLHDNFQQDGGTALDGTVRGVKHGVRVMLVGILCALVALLPARAEGSAPPPARAGDPAAEEPPPAPPRGSLGVAAGMLAALAAGYAVMSRVLGCTRPQSLAVALAAVAPLGALALFERTEVAMGVAGAALVACAGVRLLPSPRRAAAPPPLPPVRPLSWSSLSWSSP